MLDVKITDGSGNGKDAIVTSEQSLYVTQNMAPPLVRQKTKIMIQYLTDDGTSSGSNDMVVDGSTTPQSFWIEADDDNDRYITCVNLIIADEGASLNKFGAITALTTGCDFFYETQQEQIFIGTAMKTNWDFVRMSLTAEMPVPEIKPQKDVEGKVDAYVPCINFVSILPPHGIKLDRGTNERLVVRVNDDVSGIDAFNAVSYGFDRFE